MKPAAVTESLLHDLVMSSAAEGTGQTAVAAAVTLGERILLCGHDTRDFDREWDLPGGIPLPGETLTSALSRILACDYGLDATEFGAYLGSHDIVHDGEIIRTFVFTATCADPAQICQHARTAHCWADPADLPEASARSPPRSAPGARASTATKPPPNCSSGTGPGCAGTTSPRSSSPPRPGRPGPSPPPSAGKRPSPPCRQETCPAQAAKPPSHPSPCETSSPDSTRPTSTSSSTRSGTPADGTSRQPVKPPLIRSSENRGTPPSRRQARGWPSRHPDRGRCASVTAASPAGRTGTTGRPWRRWPGQTRRSATSRAAAAGAVPGWRGRRSPGWSAARSSTCSRCAPR